MTTIHGPILREIEKIQSGIGLPPSTNESDYGQCRAYTKNSTPCQKKVSKARKGQAANLLSEFLHVTDDDQVDNFYDKMAKFINLTHCHLHGSDALKAFAKWKTERIAAASSSSSTPVTNGIFSNDSLDSSSETSSVASPAPSSPVSGNVGCSPSASDLEIEEGMRSLVLNSNLRNVTTRRSNGDTAQIRKLRHRLKRLGNFELPREGAQQDPLKIFMTIKNPPPPGRMSDGKVYIYKHNSIPGILKIGYSTNSMRSRQRQSGNCYGIDTDIVHETKKRFAGAFQAERIIHAVLKHKKVQIYNCSNCGKGHKEWFLISEDEALKVVKCAESWLQMPAYTMHQGRFQLSPRAEVIFDSMLNFSTTDWNQHIDKSNPSDDASDTFSVQQLLAAVREISISTSTSSATGNDLCMGQTGGNSTKIFPTRPEEQILPIKRAESALQTLDRDTVRELMRPHPVQSAHSDGDEDDNDYEESEELESGEDYSEIESEEFDEDEEDIEVEESEESEEFDGDEEDIEVEESEEFDGDEEDVEEEESEDLGSGEEDEDEESQELDSDEETSEADEPQETSIDEDSNQARGFQALTRIQTTKVSPNMNLDVVEILKAIRRGGAVEFRVIFPSQDLHQSL